MPSAVDFVDPIFSCLQDNVSMYLTPDLPGGIGPVAIGAIGSFLGGINLVLDFLPVPDPLKVGDLSANIAKPDFLPNLFVKAFSAPGLPAIPIKIGGFDFKVGDVKLPIDAFDPGALIDLVVGLITFPMDIFKGLIDSIINLSPKIPTLDSMLKIGLDGFGKLGFDIGKDGPIFKLIKCLVAIFVTIIGKLLPV